MAPASPLAQHVASTHNKLDIRCLDGSRLLDLQSLKCAGGLGGLGALDLAALEREGGVLEFACGLAGVRRGGLTDGRSAAYNEVNSTRSMALTLDVGSSVGKLARNVSMHAKARSPSSLRPSRPLLAVHVPASLSLWKGCSVFVWVEWRVENACCLQCSPCSFVTASAGF
jgi:hypothetical protein